MKKIILLAILLLGVSFANAQLWDKLKKKVEEKVVQKAGDALDDNNKKTTNKNSQTTGTNADNDVAINRTFDFVPGKKVIYQEDFSSTPEGNLPSDWQANGTAEVITTSKLAGKWVMLQKGTTMTKKLQQAFPENCTIEMDLFTSNLLGDQFRNPSLHFYVGADQSNRLEVKVAYAQGKIGVEYHVTGLNDVHNSTEFDLSSYQNRALPVHISINKQRVRVWFDQIKIVDLQEVIGPKLLQSGILMLYSSRSLYSREAYSMFSNIRIADAGISERDLSIGVADEPKTTTTTTKPQPNPVTPTPRAGTLSLKDFGTYHALLIAVEDYTDPSVNKLENPVNDALQLQKTLTAAYHFDPQNVKLLKNPSKKDVFAELTRLRTAVKGTDNLLVFYAGHGYWDKDMEKGYWLPRDAERDLPTNWIANEDITGYVRAIKSKHTLLISDACFSGGIFKTREAFAGQSAVEEVYKMASRKAITSGNLTLVPDKSVFMQYFLKKLEENREKFLTEEQLFSQFKTAVVNNSPGQIPQFGTIINTGDEGGNFVFIRK